MTSITPQKKSPVSFLQAFVSIFNIFHFNEKPPRFLGRSDADAMAEDWRAVGDDLRQASGPAR